MALVRNYGLGFWCKLPPPLNPVNPSCLPPLALLPSPPHIVWAKMGDKHNALKKVRTIRDYK